MSDTIQKYRDYVITGFMKSVVPIVVDRASGAVITDINGREYLDCFAGISVVSAGHCNPQVIAAAKRQMEKLVHCSSYIYHVQAVADLAEKIAHIAPRGLTKTFFGNSGAEAIEGEGMVRIETDVVDRFFVIRVKDTGPRHRTRNSNQTVRALLYNKGTRDRTRPRHVPANHF